MDKKDILQAVKAGKDFDFVANNYLSMSKSDLADLYKELNYSIYTFLPADEYKRFLAHFIETCEDSFSEE
jgi:hypothetical protein